MDELTMTKELTKNDLNKLFKSINITVNGKEKSLTHFEAEPFWYNLLGIGHVLSEVEVSVKFLIKAEDISKILKGKQEGS